MENKNLADPKDVESGKYSLKLASLAIFFSCLLTIVGVGLSWFPSNYLWGLLIYLPLAYFIYRGKRWAIVFAMILITLDKLVQGVVLSNGNTASAKSIFFWWLFFMAALYPALDHTSKLRKENMDSKKTEDRKSSRKINFLVDDKNSLKIKYFQWGTGIFLLIVIMLSVSFIYQKIKVSECILKLTQENTVLPAPPVGARIDLDQLYRDRKSPEAYRDYCEDIYKFW